MDKVCQRGRETGLSKFRGDLSSVIRTMRNHLCEYFSYLVAEPIALYAGVGNADGHIIDGKRM